MLNAAKPTFPKIPLKRELINNNFSDWYNGMEALENPALKILAICEVILENSILMSFNVPFELKK